MGLIFTFCSDGIRDAEFQRVSIFGSYSFLSWPKIRQPVCFPALLLCRPAQCRQMHAWSVWNWGLSRVPHLPVRVKIPGRQDSPLPSPHFLSYHHNTRRHIDTRSLILPTQNRKRRDSLKNLAFVPDIIGNCKELLFEKAAARWHLQMSHSLKKSLPTMLWQIVIPSFLHGTLLATSSSSSLSLSLSERNSLKLPGEFAQHVAVARSAVTRNSRVSTVKSREMTASTLWTITIAPTSSRFSATPDYLSSSTAWSQCSKHWPVVPSKARCLLSLALSSHTLPTTASRHLLLLLLHTPSVLVAQIIDRQTAPRVTNKLRHNRFQAQAHWSSSNCHHRIPT